MESTLGSNTIEKTLLEEIGELGSFPATLDSVDVFFDPFDPSKSSTGYCAIGRYRMYASFDDMTFVISAHQQEHDFLRFSQI